MLFSSKGSFSAVEASGQKKGSQCYSPCRHFFLASPQFGVDSSGPRGRDGKCTRDAGKITALINGSVRRSARY
jgi:hypothetical protein